MSILFGIADLHAFAVFQFDTAGTLYLQEE